MGSAGCASPSAHRRAAANQREAGPSRLERVVRYIAGGGREEEKKVGTVDLWAGPTRPRGKPENKSAKLTIFSLQRMLVFL